MFQGVGAVCRCVLCHGVVGRCVVCVALVLCVGRVSGQPWPIPDWQTADSAAEVGFWSSGLQIYSAWLDNEVSAGPYGTVVLRFGKIAFEQYGGGATESSTWELGSIRKPIGGALLGIALEDELLSLDTVAFDVWPDIFTITGEEKDKGITVRQLVTATSGWKSTGQPGEQWRYSNVAFSASHAVIGGAYGLLDDEIASMVESRIKDAIGATSWDVYHFSNSWDSNTGPKLAVDSTMRDAARYGYLWLRGGEWNGDQIVPAAYVLQAQQNQVASYGKHYGYYWFTNDGQELLPDAPDDVYYHVGHGVGGRRTVVLVAPSLDLVAATSTQREAFDLGGADFLLEPVSSVNEWLRQIVAAAQGSLFSEPFSRADSDDVGNGWSEVETPTSATHLVGGSLVFDSENHAFRPLIHHSLPTQSSGELTWSFDLDFERSGSEGSYGFRMQLGEGASMVDSSPTQEGVAVNLRWGNPNETLAYVVNGTMTAVAAAINGPHTVTVRVDLDAQTFDVAVAGEVTTGVPFENAVPIDTMRFFTHVLEGSNFSSRRVDDIAVFNSTPVNFAPVAAHKNLVTESDVSVGITLSFTDPDGPGPYTPSVNDPANGVLTGTFPNFTYAPNSGFGGLDSFTWSIDDGVSQSNLATVNVSVGVPDADNDGVADFDDNCPQASNADQTDSDGDGEGDACDIDDDGDGVADTEDNCRLAANADQRNTDGDDEGDVCDIDDDGDAVIDAADNCPLDPNPTQTDTDGNGAGDVCDTDDDGDGVLDAEDNCPLDANFDQTNTDGDGEGDRCDADDDGDGLLDSTDNCPVDGNQDQTDTDSDGAGNACDLDDDNDGVPDTADNCPLSENEGQADTDGDGGGNACDIDDDGDGVADSTDNCPLVSNVGQGDTDGDGRGDVCSDDDDGDGVPDETDNCPGDGNSEQTDTDGDSVGDICDGDDDGDGLADDADNCPLGPNVDQTDADGDGNGDVCDDDDDGDGIIDASDNCPSDANADQVDTDADGEGNSCDVDDDDDGVEDLTDNCRTIPNADQTNSDLDRSVGDACDVDDDDDGELDEVDNCRVVYNPDQEDTDGNGFGDVCDDDIDGDEVTNTDDNCVSVPNADQGDADADALGDACDPDDDNDELSDDADNCPLDHNPDQADSDGDGLGDACDGPSLAEFIRGDVNANDKIEIGDPVTILFYLFRGSAEIDCLDVADANDDGQVGLADAVYVLRYQFLGEDPPPEPFPTSGIDPTPDALPPCVD